MASVAGIHSNYKPDTILRLSGSCIAVTIFALLACLFILYLFAIRVSFSFPLLFDNLSFVASVFFPLSIGALFFLIFPPLGYIMWLVFFFSYAVWLVCSSFSIFCIIIILYSHISLLPSRQYNTIIAEMQFNRLASTNSSYNSYSYPRTYNFGAIAYVCIVIAMAIGILFYSIHYSTSSHQPPP